MVKNHCTDKISFSPELEKHVSLSLRNEHDKSVSYRQSLLEAHSEVFEKVILGKTKSQLKETFLSPMLLAFRSFSTQNSPIFKEIERSKNEFVSAALTRSINHDMFHEILYQKLHSFGL